MSQIPLPTQRERLSLFLSGVMQAAESIALRNPGDVMKRERLMTSRLPAMVEELLELTASPIERKGP